MKKLEETRFLVYFPILASTGSIIIHQKEKSNESDGNGGVKKS